MKGPPEPKAILLDLDGTLADSLAVMRQSYELFLRTHGREPSDAEFESLNGPPLLEIVRRLKIAHALSDDAEALVSRYSDVVDRTYSRVEPSAGALELIEKAKVHHCTVGIVTSNTRRRTRAWLESVGLLNMVDFIVAGEDVKHGKPHPEPYRHACLKTACDPALIAAIEDSPQGAKSSLAAGLRTLALGVSVQGWPQGAEPIGSLFQAAEKLWR
jgi:HAD superfamily hydrolase (TIGR01509 family)